MPGLVVMAIVRCENHQRVLSDSQAAQQIQQTPRVPVHARDHGCLALILVGPVLISIGTVVRDLGAVTGHA